MVILVNGMVCMSCVNSIESMMSEKHGVSNVKVSLQNKEAVIDYDSNVTTIKDLVTAIDDMGFDAAQKSETFKKDEHNVASVVINIDGMTCNSCVNNIQSVIGSREHVRNILVSLQDKNASIDFDSSQESSEELCKAICEMGFEAFLVNNDDSILKRVMISVEGMTCQSCVRNITEMMSSKQGVQSINVSLERKNALIEYDSSLVNTSFLCQSIEEMGFDAYLNNDDDIEGKCVLCCC